MEKQFNICPYHSVLLPKTYRFLLYIIQFFHVSVFDFDESQYFGAHKSKSSVFYWWQNLWRTISEKLKYIYCRGLYDCDLSFGCSFFGFLNYCRMGWIFSVLEWQVCEISWFFISFYFLLLFERWFGMILDDLCRGSVQYS